MGPQRCTVHKLYTLVFALITATISVISYIPKNYEILDIPHRLFAMASTPKCYAILLTSEKVNFYSKHPIELKQFREILKQKPSFRHLGKSEGRDPLPAANSYSFDLACFTGNYLCGIVIFITERRNGSLTSGGSSFRILFRSVSCLVCTFKDCLNGTYIAFCPAPAHESTFCIVITVDVLYVNYDAYRGNEVPLNTLLWNNSICSAGGGRCTLGNLTKGKVIERTSLPDVTPLRMEQNSFHWRTVNGELRLLKDDIVDGERHEGTYLDTINNGRAV